LGEDIIALWVHHLSPSNQNSVRTTSSGVVGEQGSPSTV
jgi:hypothetical protein